MLLILALGKQKKVDFCELKASIVYRVSFRTAKATERNSILKNKTKKNLCV